MSGSTTELALKTAVDADDTADYLTLSLADSLRTLDGLFNNTTGHSHSGAHQGGPIGSGSITTGQIADGAITSAKIADGTITSADIADGTIATVDIAANAVQQLLGSYEGIPTFSSSAVTTWLTTPVTVNATSGGGLCRVEATVPMKFSVASTIFFAGLALDTATPFLYTPVGAHAFANGVVLVHINKYMSAAAGAHTFNFVVLLQVPGTLSIDTNGHSQLYVVEQKR